MPTLKQNGWAEISHSRSKKKPFKVKVYAHNGETIVTSQLVTTVANANKNIYAALTAFRGKKILIHNKIGGEWIWRLEDGRYEKVK